MKYLKIISVLVLSLVFTTLLPSQSPAYAEDNRTCTMSYPDKDNKKITCEVFPEGIDVNTEDMQVVCSDLPGDKGGAYRLETYPQEAAPSNYLGLLGLANNWFSYNLGRDKYQTPLVEASSIDDSEKTNVAFYLNKSDHSRILSSGSHSFNLLWEHPRYSPIKCSPAMSYTVNSGNAPVPAEPVTTVAPAAPAVPAPAPKAATGNKGAYQECIHNSECRDPLKCLYYYTTSWGETLNACQRKEGIGCDPNNNECQVGLKCIGDLASGSGTCQKPSAPAPAAQAPAVVSANDPYAAGYYPPAAVPGELGLDAPCDPNNDNCQFSLECAYSFDDASKQGKYSCQKRAVPIHPPVTISVNTSGYCNVSDPQTGDGITITAKNNGQKQQSYLQIWVSDTPAFTQYAYKEINSLTADAISEVFTGNQFLLQGGKGISYLPGVTYYTKAFNGDSNKPTYAFGPVNTFKIEKDCLTPTLGKLGLDTPCDPNNDNCQSPLKCTYSFDDVSKQEAYTCQKQSKPGLTGQCDNTDKEPCQGDLQCVWAYTDTTVRPNKNIYTCQNPPKISEGLQCGDLRNNGKCVDGTECLPYSTNPDTGENIYTCQKPAAGAVPGQGSGGKIPTQIWVHIHGANDGSLDLMKLDQGVVDVGARVYTDDTITSADPRSAYCNTKIKTVNLFFEKIADSQSRAITPRLMNINLNGNSQPTNCWSFAAKVDGAGQYRLRATYPGDDKFAPSEGVAYIIIADKTAGAKYAKGSFSTTTTIKIKPSNKNLNDAGLDLSQKTKTRMALQKGMKVSTTEQAINLLELVGAKAQDKIAGLAVKNEGGKYVLYNDPNSSSDGFEITPATAVEGEECSIDKIPAVNLVVNKILPDGSTEPILNEPNYPNCHPTTITYSQLGDISQINRVEISAGYPNDATSLYNPSSGDLVLYMSDAPVEVKPYVKLSSNPAADKITPYDGSAQVVAVTNKVSQSPTFEVNHNGVIENKPASSASDNCSNGNGVCSYYLNIYQPMGQFTITFKNEGVLDTLSFNTDDNTGTKTETDVIGAGILIGGREVTLPLDGSQIDLKLDPAGSNVYQVIIHRSNGLSDLRKTIIFNYSPSQSAQNCPDNLHYCDNGRDIWKHGGVPDDTQPGGCRYAFENTGPCQSGPADTNPQPQPAQSCPDDLRYCDNGKGHVIWKHGGVPDSTQPDGCRYAFTDTEQPCQ